MKKLFFICFLFNFYSCFSINDKDLFKAIKEDNIELINKIDWQLEDINRVLQDTIENKCGEVQAIIRLPLLSYALKFGSMKIAYSLIKDGANLNKKGMILDMNYYSTFEINPLQFALENKNIPNAIIELLINCGAFYKNQSILQAILNPMISETKICILIESLKKLFGDRLIEEAFKENNLKILKILVINGVTIPPNAILIARKLKVRESIIEYLKYQLNISKVVEDATGFPKRPTNIISEYCYGSKYNLNELLIEAMYEKNIEFIKNFVKSNSNVNYSIKTSQNKPDRTLLQLSIFFNSEAITKYLIEQGASFNLLINLLCDNIGSPLLCAFTNQKTSLSLVKFLIGKIENIELIKFQSKSDVFNLAHLLTFKEISQEKKEFIMDLLISKFSENVLDFVLENRNISLEVIKSFIEYGAKVTKNTINKAKLKGYSKSIINYLNVLERANLANTNLPSKVLNIITQYYIEEESSNCILS